MDTDDFPLQYARTRRFSLGVPQQFTVSPDGERVLFLRSASGSDPRTLLWQYQDGAERPLADPADSAAGVGGYATDREARLVAFTVDGALWTVRTDGGAPRRLPVPAPVADPRPSPDGTLIAYLSAGALRVVRADGTADRPLAEPEGPDVSHGLPDFTARESIGRARGYWWSPASDALLVTRVDQSMVHRRWIADPANPDRPPRVVRYPAAGTPNAETTLRLVALDGRHTPVGLPDRATEPERTGTAGAGEWHAPAFEYLVGAGWGPAGPVAAVQTRDQRTVRVLRIDPATGRGEPLSEHRAERGWVLVPPGTPALTDAGVPVLPHVRGDAWSIRIGALPAPAGLQVRAVAAVAGERVLFTASEEPTEVHVWSYTPAAGFTRLTSEPGVHAVAAGGGTLVLDSRTEDGQAVTVLRDGRPTGRIEVLAERPRFTRAPIHLSLGVRELRTRLHLPSWYRPGSDRLPVLLSPYAGPGMQLVTRARAWYTDACQWFAEQGFAVLATDGRGTPGRGVAWQHAILGDRLGPVLTDQIDALHAAAERCDALDLDRVGIRGWSFSGYLAAGAVLLRPDVFHAAVAGAPPTDRRLYDSFWEERFLGHPDVQPENYQRSSLLPHAHRLSRPLLLVHGLADDNVYPAHTLRLSAALLAAGRPHRVLPLPGVGHQLARSGVADQLLRAELDFFRSTLGG
ncbi:prolyl oligopeptidase family serine peptidase [Streptacidiphilus sp. P02-A3a]|uniref:prolyl oligopeptidase family serine peptidase n=1 Tax=Streptacidiphilus sp. P02-A3a TaxID=2704468 RepID=UPI0015FBF0B6|nr:prolyl oligopeptidase family serine peptidase [Streptacidiphilus sp. P02-A3a]QMU73276.1 prolyl oligopeptidase family serine peptidase [Streptacidiphilus sp. P02-A3a]